MVAFLVAAAAVASAAAAAAEPAAVAETTAADSTMPTTFAGDLRHVVKTDVDCPGGSGSPHDLPGCFGYHGRCRDRCHDGHHEPENGDVRDFYGIRHLHDRCRRD